MGPATHVCHGSLDFIRRCFRTFVHVSSFSHGLRKGLDFCRRNRRARLSRREKGSPCVLTGRVYSASPCQAGGRREVPAGLPFGLLRGLPLVQEAWGVVAT